MVTKFYLKNLYRSLTAFALGPYQHYYTNMPWGKRKHRVFTRSPLTFVEFIIGLSTIAGGLYVLSPFFKLSALGPGRSALVAMLGSTIGLHIFGIIFLVSGIFTVVGVWRRNYRMRAIALFVNILARTYSFLGTFIIQGPLPLTWLSSPTVILIAVVCYMFIKSMVIRGVKED